MFGDEIRSYAKKSAYDPQVRVNQTDKPDAGSVVTRYFVTGSQTEVFAGWYKGSDEAGWTKVDDALVKHNAYAEEKIYVERSVDHYLVVNYDNGDSSQWQRYSGQEEVLSDDFSCYYLDAEGVRHDLEPVYAYKHDGTAVEGKRILTEKSEGQPDKYYYMLKTDVTLRYAPEDGGTSYAQTQVETRYFGTVQGQQNTELVAYHAGVWYLLLEMDNETGADTPITEMGHLITKITGEINSITLGQMYLHELIDESPDISIEHFQYQKDDGGYYTNLNELTISGVIKLIRHISETFGH